MLLQLVLDALEGEAHRNGTVVVAHIGYGSPPSVGIGHSGESWFDGKECIGRGRSIMALVESVVVTERGSHARDVVV